VATIDCICPARPDGTPRHAHGDTVTLRPSLDFVGLARARNVVLAMRVEADANAPEIQAAVTEAYLLQGITAWTVVDADGDAVPPTKDAIRGYLLARPSAAIVVGDELYSAALMDALDPLVKAASSSSPATPTTESTSQPTDSPTKPRKHSKRSSTTTTQTDGIVRISPRHDGDSNSSQSSASAG
jgi:hypothetical protein